jgi:hypothetical protein
MLVFVIPLKSQKVSQSWERTSKLFERCIQSVCNQTSQNFRAIVVCHEKPHIEFDHPKITYFQVDFPAPNNEIQLKREDKWRKAVLGTLYAKQFQPSHLMKVDADDCISNRIAALVEQNPYSNGWFMDNGYLYEEGSRFIFLKRKKFYKWCGSCNLLKYSLYKLPETIEEGISNFKQYYYNHNEIVENLSQQGTPLQPFPFPGAVYMVATGDNISPSAPLRLIKPPRLVSRVKQAIYNFRPLSQSIREEFGIYNLISE